MNTSSVIMWKQTKTTVLQFFIWLSVCLAACPLPDISSVNVTYGEVQWEGSYNESCLRGFEVCWSVPSAGAMSCEGVPPNFTSLTIKDVQPCALVTVEVSAILDGLNGSAVVTAKGEGYAGLPQIADLKVVTSSRNFLWLTWSPLSSYACVDSVNLWVCDNAVPDVWSCVLKEVPQNFTMIKMYDYNFPVCHYYYAFAYTINGVAGSHRDELVLYIPSDNRLTDAAVTDVTANSAILQYWLSIVDYNCTTESFQICYADTNDLQQVCQNVQMNQVNSTGLFQLSGLNACATYWAKLSVENPKDSSYSKKLTFITPRGDRSVLVEVTATANDYDVEVRWTTANLNVPCISYFIVSWNSTTRNQTSWSSAAAYTRSYAISTHYETQTVFVEVAAVFVDGGQESLSCQVYYRGLPNLASHSTVSTGLLWLVVITFSPLFALS